MRDESSLLQLNIIPVSELTKEQYKKYAKLTLPKGGLMRFYLKSAFENDECRLNYRRNETVISITKDDKVMSWALLLDARMCGVCKWKKSIHVYTRANQRGKGYADIIVKKCIDMTKPKRIYCRGNSSFFKRYGIKYG